MNLHFSTDYAGTVEASASLLSVCNKVPGIERYFLFGIFFPSCCIFLGSCYNIYVFVVVLLCEEIEDKVRYMKDDCIR